jgi:hypothetical protein
MPYNSAWRELSGIHDQGTAICGDEFAFVSRKPCENGVMRGVQVDTQESAEGRGGWGEEIMGRLVEGQRKRWRGRLSNGWTWGVCRLIPGSRSFV